MPDARNAVARRAATPSPDAVANLTAFVEKMTSQVARALPRHLDGDRMTRLAVTAIRNSPKLALCSDMAFAGALMQAAAMGLEPNTPSQHCFLVPYEKGRGSGNFEPQLIMGYQGFVHLYHQHPMAGSLDARVVRAADSFDYQRGSNGYLHHRPARGKPEDRGEIIYYYADATLANGAYLFEVLEPWEVEQLRNGKVGPSGDIPDPQHWMERKTVIRQLYKVLPKTPNMARAAAVDDQPGGELYKAAAAERLDLDPAAGRAPEGPPPPAPAGDATPMATEAQLGKLTKLYGDHGVDTDDAIHAALTERLGRPVTSRKELTKAEASGLIDELTKAAPGGAQ